MDAETQRHFQRGQMLATRRQIIVAAGRPSRATDLTRLAFDFALAAGELSTVRAAVIRGVEKRWPGYQIDAVPEVIADRLRCFTPAGEPLFVVPSRSGLMGWLCRPDLDERDELSLEWLLGLWLAIHPGDEWLLRLAFAAEDAAAIAREMLLVPAEIPRPEYRWYFGRCASLGFLVPYSGPSGPHFSAAVHPRAVADHIASELLLQAMPLEPAQVVFLGSNDQRSLSRIQTVRKRGPRDRSKQRKAEAVVQCGRAAGVPWKSIGQVLHAARLITRRRYRRRRKDLDPRTDLDGARNLWKGLPAVPPLPPAQK
jgi:hypothetical protein